MLCDGRYVEKESCVMGGTVCGVSCDGRYDLVCGENLCEGRYLERVSCVEGVWIGKCDGSNVERDFYVV